MKKKILTLILPAITMVVAGCGEQPQHEHTFSDKWNSDETSHWHDATCGHDAISGKGDHNDSNKDHKCDVCERVMSEHTDSNKDHKCDVCGETMGEHADKNNDHNCDYCGEKMSEHVDSNKDHRCDICGEAMGEHADKNNDHNCDYCGEKMSEHIDSNKDHTCDVCGEVMGEHADKNNDHNCDYCGEKMSEHVDSNKDHTCDICGEVMGEHADKNNDHNCDYCGEKMSEHSDSNKDHLCDVCGEKISEHVDSNKNHECDVCGETMGEHADKNNDHNCDYCGEKLSDHIDTTGDGKCDICGEEMTPEENKELDKFNELVASIKKGHNYTLTINSIVEGLEEDELNCHRYNLNDKAWFHDDTIYDAEGIIYQKDQGYVTFVKNGNNIIPMSLADDFDYETDPRVFTSTNTALGISDLTEVIGENLFIGEYTQDSTNKANFSTTSIDNRAVAAYLTQYYEYISTGQLQIDNSMSAVVDVTNSTITLKLNYTLWYFDEEEVQAPGTITIKLENVGGTSDEVIGSYIENPSYTFSAPTVWPDNMNSVFGELNNSVTPTIPSGLSYAAVCEKILYDGFFYAGVQDLDSGDLRESYGETLLGEGFTKVSDNSYKKVIMNGVNSVTYKVIMKYIASSSLYPNGEMMILFRADKSSGVFATIEDFNAYLASMKYDELVPALPAEATCTSISNFKDQTDNEIYALKCNSTDTFRVNIPNYAKASAFASAYIQALIEKGYSDTSKFLSMTNYGLDWSTSGTYVGIDFPDSEGLYAGYIGIRYIVTKSDEQSLRPSEKHTVSASASITNGSIDFGGVTQYAAGSTVNFTISPASGYEFESASVVGTDIKVTVTGNKGSFVMPDDDVEVLVTFKECAPTPTYAINFTCDHFTVDHFEDESGKIITSYVYKEGAFGIFAYGSFDEGYEYDSFTLEGDDNALGASWFDDERGCDVIQIYPTIPLDEWNITVLTKGAAPAPTHAISFNADHTSDIAFYSEAMTPITKFESGDGFMVYMHVEEGYEYKSAALDGDSEALIYYWDDEGYFVLYVMPSKTLDEYNVSAVFESAAPAPTKYSISVDSSLSGGSIKNIVVNGSSSTEAESGDGVRFTVSAAEGYTLVSDSVKVTDASGNPVSISLAPMSSSTYTFTMPASNVTITAEFEADSPAPSTYSINKDSVEGLTIKIAGMISEAEEGEVVKFSLELDDGYTLDGDPFIKDHPEIQIDKSVNPFTSAVTYMFDMPAHDVTISADVLAPAPAKAWHVQADSSIENGSISFAESYYDTGEKVEFTVTPDSGYEIGTVSSNPSVAITDEGNGKYSFNMPASDVTVSVTFSSIPTPEPVAHTVSAVGDVYDGDTKVGRVATWYKYVEVFAGDMAYVTITPQPGYEVVRAYVQGHEEITLSDASAEMGSNKWGFEMPDYDVTIVAEFRPIPKDLTDITLSGQKVSFTVGDEFSVGSLVVTASYANGEKGTVIGYTVDSSKVDMNTAGSYDVTISYTEGEITKTKDYSITVQGADVKATVYQGSSGNYSYTLTIYEDGTGLYQLNKNGTIYNQYFTWTDAGSGKINIVGDPSTSTLCPTDNYNLFFYWASDSGSYKNTITLDDTSASFKGYTSNGGGMQKSLTLTIVQ